MGLFEDRDRRAEQRQAESEWESAQRLRSEADARQRESVERDKAALASAEQSHTTHELNGLVFARGVGGINVSFKESNARLRTADDVVNAVYEALKAQSENRAPSFSKQAQAERARVAQAQRDEAAKLKAEQDAAAVREAELKNAERLVAELDAARALLKSAKKDGAK